MLKFLLGPLLLGAGYVAGSYYGSDTEQLVHKNPSVTYAAFGQALDSLKQSGTTSFEGGTPVPYELKIDRSADQKLVVALLFAGKTGAEVDIDFTPEGGGANTRVAARIHADRAILRNVLDGTSRARLAYAPDWMLNLTFKPVLQQLADEIERGDLARVAGVSQGETEAQWESALPDDQREKLSEWRQYDATRPATDPDADARQYLAGGNSGSE